MTKAGHIYYMSACLLAAFLTGCTEVPLDYDNDVKGSSQGLTRIELDWSKSGVAEADRPDSITTVFGRMVELSHKWIRTGTYGMAPEDTLILPTGEWICLAANEEMTNVTLKGVDEFMANDTSAVKDIAAMVDTLTYSELKAIRGVVDPNPGMPNYKNISGLYSAYTKATVSGGQDNTILLEMQELSAPVTFRIRIRIDGDVVIERLVGEVSGVPGEVDLMSREAVASKAGKTLFEMAKTPTSTDSLYWSGEARVAGIVAPEDEKVIVGNGILCVRAYVRTGGKKMIFIASINLKKLLDEKPLLVQTDRLSVYRCVSETSYEFVIPALLYLTPTGVAPGSDGPGLMEWVNQAKIDGGV